MGAFRCLILDLDGTVIDSHAYTFAAFRHACAPFRSPPEDDEIYERFGPDEGVILRDLVGEPHAAEALVRMQAYYAAHVQDVAVHPEVQAVLATCGRLGLSRGLFTGRGRAATHLLLQGLGLRRHFDAIVAGDDAAPKPAADGIALLLRILGRGRSETLVVGDSPLDLQAAQAAGVQAMLAAWYSRGASHEDAATKRLTTPSQLAAVLGLPAAG